MSYAFVVSGASLFVILAVTVTVFALVVPMITLPFKLFVPEPVNAVVDKLVALVLVAVNNVP